PIFFIHRHFMVHGQFNDPFGQFALTLGGDGGSLFAALVEQRNGFAMFAHQVTSSIQRCCTACCGAGGLPRWALSSPTSNPRVSRRSRSRPISALIRCRVSLCSAQNSLLTRPLYSRAMLCMGPRLSRLKARRISHWGVCSVWRLSGAD